MLSRAMECFRQSWNAFNKVGIHLYRVGMLSRGLECFLEGWNDSYWVGMLSKELEYLCTELEYPCTELECFLQAWNAFDRVGIPLYRVGMLPTGLECF
jgi:hypothetical protein